MRRQFIADVLCVLVLLAALATDGILFAHWVMSFGPNEQVSTLHVGSMFLLFLLLPAVIVAIINTNLQRWARKHEKANTIS